MGGGAAYVQQMKFIEGNRCWYKLELSALHIQYASTWTNSKLHREDFIGIGKFEVTTQVQGHHQGHPMLYQGHS